MPPVIAWVATAIVSATGISLAAATWVSTLLVNGAIMFAAQKLLGKKPNMGEFMGDVAERTQMVRQSTAPRRLIYGRCKVSGNMVYGKETGTKREYLHMVIVLASHECDSILDIFVNDELVEMNGDVPAAGNRYDGFLRVTKHLGTAAQAADANLVAECAPEWTTDHRLRGHAYLAVRVKYDESVFPTGLPTIAAIPRGVKVMDPRDGITRWTSNVALCVYHYMQSSYGLGIPDAEFDLPSVIAAANVCDEDVGLATSFTRQCDIEINNRHIGMTTQALAQMDDIQPGMLVAGAGIPVGSVIVSINREGPASYFFTIDKDPTATNNNTAVTFGDSEKRYTLNGTVDTSTRAGDVIEAMLSAMAGKAVYAGGKWFLHAGAYQTPTISLSEDDCRGPIQVTTKLPRRELANLVKGVYVSEADGWVATDFPQYAPALYLTEDDNEELPRDIQLPFTTSSSAAQRLAKIELERIRQQILTRWPCKLSALKVQCGDNVMLNSERYGWVNKVFEVVSFILVPYKDDRGNPAIGVDLVLRETASGVWDWADGAETVTDLAPNTNLHNPFIVTNPTLLVLLADGTTSWIDNDGAHRPRLKVSWTAPNDQYVLSGGKIQVQYKKSSSGVWLDWAMPPGDQVEEFITDVEGGVNYDVRIRSVSRRGIPAATWVQQVGYLVNGDVTACDPVSGGIVTGLPESIRISWTLPDLTVDPNTDMDYVELYEAGSFVAPLAGTAATFRAGKENTYLRSNVSAGSTGYYWGRTVDNSRNKSAWVYLGTASALNGVSYVEGLATNAQNTANAAVTSANGKNTNFYQAGTPTAIRTGDTWFKIGTDEIYNWNGSSWVQINLKAGAISGQLTNAQIASIEAAKITTQIVSTQITDGAISTPKLAAGAVTTNELAANAVVAAKIAAGEITSTHISTNQIVTNAANIADGIITNAKIVNLDAGKITAGTINAAIALGSSGSLTVGSGFSQFTIDGTDLNYGALTIKAITDGNQINMGKYAFGALSTGFFANGWDNNGNMGLIYNGSNTIDGVANNGEWRAELLRARSTSDPRSTSAPLYSAGGAWVAGSLDQRGTAYFNSHLEIASANKIKFSAASPTDVSIQEDWGVRVNASSQHPFHVRGGALCLNGCSGGGTSYTNGRFYLTDTVYLYESGGSLYARTPGSGDVLIA